MNDGRLLMIMNDGRLLKELIGLVDDEGYLKPRDCKLLLIVDLL